MRVMRRPFSPRYERPSPAEIRFAGFGSREAQSQCSGFKPWLEQYLTFSRWSAKPRHVKGAGIALTARTAKGCHEVGSVDFSIRLRTDLRNGLIGLPFSTQRGHLNSALAQLRRPLSRAEATSIRPAPRSISGRAPGSGTADSKKAWANPVPFCVA